MDKHFLVVGYGSIGARHARIIQALGGQVSIVSRRPAPVASGVRNHPSIEEAFRSGGRYDGVIIANETVLHQDSLGRVRALAYAGPVLVEKPVGVEEAAVLPSIAGDSESTWVGYNLRFHPGILKLRQWCASRRILNLSVRVGQDLGAWRPSRNVAETYSARRAHGGGVLRDLSHELDYIAWIFGPIGRVASMGGRMSDLPIDSDDCWAIIMEAARCPVISLTLDYLDKIGLRHIAVNAADDSVHLDLVANEFRTKGDRIKWTVERDETYRSQIVALAGGKENLCTYAEGIEVMKTIAAIEAANLK